MTKNDLALFEDHKIRRVYNEKSDTWFFSVIDVVGALTDSTNPGAYWRKLKQRLTQENSEVVTKCHRLKLKTPDGKMRKTDCANTESLFRIIQSIPSSKAELFKLWLANNIMTNDTSISLNNYWAKHYAKLSYWTREEAVTLAVDLNPRWNINTLEVLKRVGDQDVPLLELLNRAIECNTIKVQDNKIKPLDFIKWCKAKDIPIPQKLDVLVNEHHTPEAEDLEAKYQRSEKENNDKDMLIQNLKEENERLREDLKPLHGGERNGWIKLFAGFIGANYDNLLSKKNIRDWVEVIYKDFENVESSTNIELYDITFEKSTLIGKLTMVQKYCKEHSKPSTKK